MGDAPARQRGERVDPGGGPGTRPVLSINKIVRAATGNWTFGGLLRYTSGMPIGVPGSTASLNSLIFQSTRMNRVPGQPLFLIRPA
jgi:hypothetical protein